MNAKEEQKERSHETILDSASRLLREKGIAGARVAEVMKGAGLTVGGFYAHFESKEALIEEALRRTSAGMRRRLFARIEEKPPADRAEVVLKRYLSTSHRDIPTEGCPLPAVVGEIGTTAPEHAEILREQLEIMLSDLEGHLPPSASKGAIVKSEKAEVPSRRHMALGLIALMYGGISLARALRGTELSDDVLRACRALGAFAARSSGAG